MSDKDKKKKRPYADPNYRVRGDYRLISPAADDVMTRRDLPMSSLDRRTHLENLKQKPTFQQQSYDRGITGMNQRPVETPVYVNGLPGRDERVSGGRKAFDVEGFNKGVQNVVPYVSNIANAFRKTPRPVYPTAMPYQNITPPSMEAARNDVRRSVASFNTGVDRGLDAQTATAAKGAFYGQSLNQLSKINESEEHLKSNIAMDQGRLNSRSDYVNTMLINQYNDQLTEARMSDIMNSSANVSNAADKFTMIGNERRMQDLDAEKYRIMSTIFDQPLMQRLENRYKEGNKFRRGGKLTSYTNGVVKR